ncbi:MAG TPA: SsrA-binding protein [Gammaproteobacteria bacterium]|nr:SsrA-binding protein [Gammaproteobacteria bacterium]MEC8011753.1 SsrA-binding protein SmpB [Pseudomonadota bacterium]HBF07300.1 SsrA-binding protein [Gammaproteobacteria bacterium]HCK94427.1 SsrA-binding protein [Gammaproteobacteria bacterium]|tara:strand:+ start:21056 stop:21529 length:474 start_codon:yes stop_codon:yes gene_type:complete
MAGKKKKAPEPAIAVNKRASFDYFLEETFEAGLALEGWEVKSLRDKKLSIGESYIVLKGGEAWIVGAQIVPLKTASTHITPDPTRTRKLLLHKAELAKIFSGIQRNGYTCVPVRVYWVRGRAKILIALAKGKQQQDKRAAQKDRDWSREKQRLARVK